MAFTRIVVATDFNESSRGALELAIELAQQFDAHITLVHSWETPAYFYGGGLYVPVDVITPIEQAARNLLETALAELKQRFPNADSMLRSGSPWQEVLNAAQEVKADLIVLGTHGRRGLNRALLGSVAERVVRLAQVPVLTVHGQPAQP